MLSKYSLLSNFYSVVGLARFNFNLPVRRWCSSKLGLISKGSADLRVISSRAQKAWSIIPLGVKRSMKPHPYKITEIYTLETWGQSPNYYECSD